MEAIKNRFPAAEITEADGRLTVTVPMDGLYDVASALRNEMGFDYLIDLVGMDWGESLGVIYYLSRSEVPAEVLALKTSATEREKPELYSVSDLWEVAEVYEREVYDFFGIRFLNHPDMRRIFLRADWKGYPLRKDYDAYPAINPVPKHYEILSDMETIPTVTM